MSEATGGILMEILSHGKEYPDDWRAWEHPISGAVRIDPDTDDYRRRRERFGFEDFGTVGEIKATHNRLFNHFV